MAKKPREPTRSEQNDEWTRRALAASIAEAREAIGDGKAIFPGMHVGSLRDLEWGWIISGALFGWIQTRARQASEEGWDLEQTIRTLGTDPEPWSAGAVLAAMPRLFEALPDFDWSKPVGSWSKSEMIKFIMTAIVLVRHASAARDVVESQVAGQRPGPT